MDFTREQQKLVSQVWEIMKKNESRFSHHFFIKIHKKNPAALKMFSFIHNIEEAPKEDDDNLKRYAMNIFRQTKKLAEGEARNLDLRNLGFAPLRRSVTDTHFQVVKEALLSTVEKAMEKKWREEKKAMERKAMEKKWREEKKAIEKKAMEEKWSEEKRAVDKAWGVAYKRLVVAIKAEK